MIFSQYFVDLSFLYHFTYLPFYENYTRNIDTVMGLDLMGNVLLDDSI